MLGILEPVTAGLIVSLINRYILGRNILEACMNDQAQQEYDEPVSVSTTVSDASSVQHVHI
jgi:hypothetical protein